MSASTSAPLPRWKTSVLAWLAIYPTITLVGAALQPLTVGLAWPVRTLVMTLLVVPLMVYIATPAVFRLAALVAPQWMTGTPVPTSSPRTPDRTTP
jgi:antibiotic biosynthesis monooxygenase (ABM) superfamily enzyme